MAQCADPAGVIGELVRAHSANEFHHVKRSHEIPPLVWHRFQDRKIHVALRPVLPSGKSASRALSLHRFQLGQSSLALNDAKHERPNPKHRADGAVSSSRTPANKKSLSSAPCRPDDSMGCLASPRTLRSCSWAMAQAVRSKTPAPREILGYAFDLASVLAHSRCMNAVRRSSTQSTASVQWLLRAPKPCAAHARAGAQPDRAARDWLAR